jgi:hypothetical protein
MPVQAVADEDNTRLLIIPRKIMTATRYFLPRAQEKLLIMSTVNFPDQKQVISSVDVVKRAHSIKRRAFLNAVNRNKIALDMRPEMIPDVRSKKVRVWVESID